MNKTIVKIVIETLQKYAYILQRDFMEIANIMPNKRASFLSNGVKMFLKNVMNDIEVFNLTIDHYYDTKTSEYFLDTVLCIKISNHRMEENIIFNPIRSHVFFTDDKHVYFNDKKITSVTHLNQTNMHSSNPLFIQNLHVCYFLLGCFKSIIIDDKDLERNRFSLSMCSNIPFVKIQKIDNGMSITTS